MGMTIPRFDETEAQTVTVTLPVIGAMQAAVVLFSTFQEFAASGAHPDEYAAAVDVMHALANAATEVLP